MRRPCRRRRRAHRWRAQTLVRRGALRYFSSAATALSITLMISSAGVSSSLDRAVHIGHAFVHRTGELELEVGQAAVAHAATKAHHGRFADARALGQLAHRHAGEAAWVGQQQRRHALLGRRQRRMRRGCVQASPQRCAHRQARCTAPVARSLLFVPDAAVARDHRAGGRWAPRAGGIRPRVDADRGPRRPAPARPSATPAPVRRCARRDSGARRSHPSAGVRRRPRARRRTPCRSRGRGTPATATRPGPSPWQRAGATAARLRAAVRSPACWRARCPGRSGAAPAGS